MKSPWKWSSTVEPEREYLVLASSIPPRSRRCTFQLFRGAAHSSQATGNHRRRDRLLAAGSPTCQAIRHAVGVARRGRPRRLCRDRAAPWADDQAEPGDGSDEIRALDHAGICRSTVVGRCAPTPELISIGATTVTASWCCEAPACSATSFGSTTTERRATRPMTENPSSSVPSSPTSKILSRAATSARTSFCSRPERWRRPVQSGRSDLFAALPPRL